MVCPPHSLSILSNAFVHACVSNEAYIKCGMRKNTRKIDFFIERSLKIKGLILHSQYFTFNKKLFTPKTVKKLEFGKAAAQIFLSGASDHCTSTRRERRQKICRKANAAKFQLFDRFRYIL